MELATEDRAILRQAPLLSGLTDSALAGLLEDAWLHRRDRGDVLFHQGEPATAFFVVLEGWVKLYRMAASGDEAVVGVFTRGDSLGEAVCFSGNAYPVNAEAVTPCRLLMISARNIADRIRRSPEIGLAMLASTSQHLHMLVRQIEELKAHTGAQRVAEFLIALAPVSSGPCTIALPYEKALIAGRLGMKPESLSRAFQRLRPAGLRIEQDRAHLADVRRLLQFANREQTLAPECARLPACSARMAKRALSQAG
ncbi:Crp/Fnr family transcriptional regulator [Faunimonas sp. B44]|uniref:Crp/Fnr family transcriptional regulator n=1 Tax=Faunimonas sp. B44 TaxID=3461493 RepID=UPI004044E64C